MKIFTLLVALAATFLAPSAPAQVILQDFSSTLGANTFFQGTWEATGDVNGTVNPNPNFVQRSGVFDITGTSAPVPTNAASSQVEFFFSPASVSIGTNTFLSVSAQALATNVATSFSVTLLDTVGRSASASFSAIDFITGVYTTVTGQLTFQSNFDPTSIDSFRISGNQPGGTDRFNISFDNVAAVSAIPEPGSTAALAGVGALAFVAWRKRRPRRQAAGLRPGL